MTMTAESRRHTERARPPRGATTASLHTASFTHASCAPGVPPQRRPSPARRATRVMPDGTRGRPRGSPARLAHLDERVRIAEVEGGGLIERREVAGREGELGGGEVGVELLDGARAEDDRG